MTRTKIPDLLEIMQKNAHSQQFDVNALLRMSDISDSYLRELMYKKYGMAPAKVIETVRLKSVLHLCITTSNVELLAHSCGFGCGKTLKRAFSRRIRISVCKAKKLLLSSPNPEHYMNEWMNNLWTTIDTYDRLHYM
ncbi:MAG: hypothetical protein IPK11_14265 [Ignavibacteria bacterium]|jgi:transcriptional regulator GlxA family with amidase domain|nr:hypothetical protein [Ignavibacteria bacterium]